MSKNYKVETYYQVISEDVRVLKRINFLSHFLCILIQSLAKVLIQPFFIPFFIFRPSFTLPNHTAIFFVYNALINLSWESNFIYSCSLKYSALTTLTSSTSTSPIKYFSK